MIASAVLVVIAVAATVVVLSHHHATRRTTPAASPPSHSPPVPPPTKPAQTADPAVATLRADFVQLESKLNATMGVAVTAVGDGKDPMMLGDWSIGKAWSTIKVPLTMAVLRDQDQPHVTDAMKVAITESDNAAAESIWAGLGDAETAEHKVEQILQETGDPTTVQSQRVRPPFTPFGQTDWSLAHQARFVSLAVCDKLNQRIFDLMGQVEPDQSWGIGTISGAQFKGGWGPDPSGAYLVRQIGVIAGPTGMIAVAIAAQPASGSFSDGTSDLTAVANWLSAHIAELPTGQCPA